jgi:hypothetical protein
MITFKSDLTERDLMHGVRLHYRTATREKWLLPLSGIILFAVFGCMALRDPSNFTNYPFLLLSILGITLPRWRALLIRRNIRRMPNFGKTITWTIGETSLRGQGDGFEFSQDWSTIYSATITKDGFLVYPQKNMYYWLPAGGFASGDDLCLATDLITKNIKKTKMVQKPV